MATRACRWRSATELMTVTSPRSTLPPPTPSSRASCFKSTRTPSKHKPPQATSSIHKVSDALLGRSQYQPPSASKGGAYAGLIEMGALADSLDLFVVKIL